MTAPARAFRAALLCLATEACAPAQSRPAADAGAPDKMTVVVTGVCEKKGKGATRDKISSDFDLNVNVTPGMTVVTSREGGSISAPDYGFCGFWTESRAAFIEDEGLVVRAAETPMTVSAYTVGPDLRRRNERRLAETTRAAIDCTTGALSDGRGAPIPDKGPQDASGTRRYRLSVIPQPR